MFAELRPHARCLGWAFLLAWVFCVFYSGSMDGLANTIEQQTGGGPTELLLNVLPVGSAVATLVIAVAAEKRLGPPAASRKIIVGAPLVAAAATPVLLVPAPDALLSSLLFVAAAVATGAGSGLMWLMWGQLYAKLSQDAIESCAPASAVLAALLSLAVMVAPPAAAIVAVSVFPLISGFLFAKEWPHAAAAQPTDHTAAPARPVPFAQAAANMGHVGFGILAACLFVSIEGSFWISEGSDALPAAGIFVVSALFMLAVSISATAGPRRVSLGFAYRWMCPVMVAGFAALIVAGPGAGAYVAAMVGIAARFAFCLITQMYFAVYAARGKATAVQAYGMGWAFVHLGDLLGVMISAPLKTAIGYGTIGASTAAAVLIVATVAAFMLAMGEGNLFPNWNFEPRTPANGQRENLAVASATNMEQDAWTRHAPMVSASPAPDAQAAIRENAVETLASAEEQAQPANAVVANRGIDGNVRLGANAASNNLTTSADALDFSSAETPASPACTAGNPAANCTTAAVNAAAPADSAPAADPLEARIAELARNHKLTPRETEVFGLLAHGRSIPYVRDALFISRDTAATHAKHIYAKLDVHSRQELIDLVMTHE